jgi:hypothetical protein
MNHLSEEDLVSAYYGDAPQQCTQHLSACAACRAEFAQIKDFLDEVRTVPVPARNDQYGREIWARVEPRLTRPAHWWARPLILAPAAAALLICAFVAGMLTTRPRPTLPTATQVAVVSQTGLSEKDSQRVLQGAVHDHLERSEILLAQLVHATPGEMDIADERSRARDLLEENRLLRETASRSGDHAHAALLDDLERVFLDLANSPTRLSSKDVSELQRRIDNQGLLFRVRVTTAAGRSKGKNL